MGKKKHKMIIEEPRVKEFVIEKPPKFETRTRRKTVVEVYAEKIDLNKEFEIDMARGKAFIIDDDEAFNSKTGVRSERGIHSPLWGEDQFNRDGYNTDYRCNCGEKKGTSRKGEYCADCKSFVTFRDIDFDMHGYIYLGKYSVINPALYQDLIKLIGREALVDILKYHKDFDVNGRRRKVATKKHPYRGLGIIGFQENFDEIIDYYHSERGRKNHYDIIKRFRSAVFTHYINVYNALLRPLIINGSKIRMFDVNKMYSIMLKNSNILKSAFVADNIMLEEASLAEIQQKFLDVYKNIISDQINGKGGIIRGSMTAARMNSSGRLLISPGTDLNVDMIDLPYIAGVEFMRPILISELSKIHNKNLRECNLMIDKAMRKFDKKIWLLMNYILHNSEAPPRVMIQRNPSLLHESIRVCKIKQIKADYNDWTFNLHCALLNGMNGDFDGDVLNLLFLIDNRLIKVFEFTQSPDHHFVCRITGDYNRQKHYIKDSAMILSELWELGKTSSYYRDWASDEEIARMSSLDE